MMRCARGTRRLNLLQDRKRRSCVAMSGAEKTSESLTLSPTKERDREEDSPSPATTTTEVAGSTLARTCRPNQELRIKAADSQNVFIVLNEVNHVRRIYT